MPDGLAKILLASILLVILWTGSFLLGVAVMVYGYGIHPQSWWFLIFGNILQLIVIMLISAVGKIVD